MPAAPDRLERGIPYPLGAVWDGLGVNFAVFSAHATRMQVCMFDSQGKREIARHDLPERTDGVWHGYLPDAAPGLVYGFRAHGPYEPHNGHRFNSHKLLLDPYAKALVGSLRWTDAAFGYRIHSPRADLSFDRRDSAPAMIKAQVIDDSFHWGDDRRPHTSWSDTIIYEAHVRGLTKLLEEIAPFERGTFAALSHPHVIDHLRRLGVTAVELMPVCAYVQDRTLLEKGLGNYWGYNTLAFFAPEPRYLASGTAHEMRMAVRRLHAAGIEVILDVVYNHTCEGNQLGPTLGWRGLDNASYYRLTDDRRYYVNDTGTGNTLNLPNARVLQMVMDSLRYWARAFRVDGFRFDLCATLGREAYGFDQGSGFFDAIRQDPELVPLKLIAEPWDVGPGGYQLGNQPPGFAEWNDRYRDAVRRTWRGDGGLRPELANRLSGSADLFGRTARKPWASVNYIASHDGMTLEDLVSFSQKHNEANREGNHDGQAENLSSSWGSEGPTNVPAIIDLRDRVKRSMLVTLFSSLGTPMLLAGDEFGRTQKGNNNAYCQDNEISWLDWSIASSERGQLLVRFVSRLVAIRKHFAMLRAGHFLHGRNHIGPGLLDIDWYDERNQKLSPEDWQNHEGRALIMYLAEPFGNGRARVTALVLNASPVALNFKLRENMRWRILVDSAKPEAEETIPENGVYTLESHAAAVGVGLTGGGVSPDER
jgi:glycogen operon protein